MKSNTEALASLSTQDAIKMLLGHEMLALMGEAFGVDCSELLAEIRELLELHPELWAMIEEDTEKLLEQAS